MKTYKYIFLFIFTLVGLNLNSQVTSQSFTYDNAGRLIQATLNDSIAIIYQYDDGGNMTLRQVGRSSPNVIDTYVVGSIQMSPNPVDQRLNIYIPEVQGVAFQIQIMDALGRYALYTRQGNFPANGQMTIDVNGMASGTYVILVIADEQIFVDKMIKM